MRREFAWPVVAVAISLVLVGWYVAAGGRDYKPSADPNPCVPRHWAETHGMSDVLQQVTLSALNGAACSLHVNQYDLALAFTSTDRLSAFGRQHHISQDRLNSAVADGINKAITDAPKNGRINALEAFGLQALVSTLPTDKIIGYVQDALRNGL
jgi:hypothetical protein